jgi:hypothetical protein
VEFPGQGDVFKIDPSAPRGAQALVFRASGIPGGAALQWMVDSKPAADGVWRLQAGAHSVLFSYAAGGKTEDSRPVRFTVLE